MTSIIDEMPENVDMNININENKTKNTNTNVQDWINSFESDLFGLGNNHYYGFNMHTLEERGNNLLKKSNTFLNDQELSEEEILRIKCWQFWIVGFLSGQRLNVVIDDISL
jgi:hypothetical protein